MLKSEIVNSLRCPIGNAVLAQENGFLVCTLCNVKFPVRDEIPVLLIDEAVLPGGVKDITQLTCLLKAGFKTKV